MEHRLSAILAADVVGYFALMEQDEGATYERLRARRSELFEPEIAELARIPVARYWDGSESS